MASGVLVADMLEGMRFALGPTIGTRKDVLERIGGVAALGDYCADDYVLGRLVWQAGRQVVLSPHVVDHVIVNRRWRASLQHQLRWMRSTRFSRPLGHVGTGLTFAMPFGIAAATTSLLAHRIGLAIAVGVWAYATRVVQSIVVGYSTLGDRRSLSDAWLYPLRDLIGFVLWCLSFVSTAIVWRGERYKLSRDGRMQPANIAARLERRPTVVRPGVARGVSPVARGFSRADSTTRAEALSRAENKR
jgi:ceramide glucosyltransferase